MEIRLAREENVHAAYELMCDMEATRLDEEAFRRILRIRSKTHCLPAWWRRKRALLSGSCIFAWKSSSAAAEG